MLDLDKKYPLGATRIHPAAYVALLAVPFLALLPFDGAVAAWARAALASAEAVFAILTIPGDSTWTLVPALAIAMICLVVWLVLPAGRKAQALRAAGIAGFVFAGVALPGLAANLLKRLIGRARPVHLDELGSLSFHPFRDWDFQSLPSGDTTTAFALAAIALFFFPRFGWIVVVGAALVGVARIGLGAHYPTDVYGGVLVGTFGAYAVRHFCLARGWLFTEVAGGRIVPKSFPR